MTKFPRVFDMQDHWVLLIFTTLVRIFSVWIQMSAIAETIVNIGYSETAGQITGYALGALFIVSMYRRGIWGSVRQDQAVWYLTILAIIAIIAIGGPTGGFNGQAPSFGGSYIPWGLWSGVLLFGGPFVDLSLIQRGKIATRDGMQRSFKIASGMFLVYQALILVMALAKFNHVMNLIFLLAVSCLAIGTLNSDAVALHRLRGRKQGLIIGLITVACWQFVKVVGFFNLWQIIANVRIYFALFIVASTIYITYKNKGVNKTIDSWDWEKDLVKTSKEVSE